MNPLRSLAFLLIFAISAAMAQTETPTPATRASIHFLEGSWTAVAQGANGAAANGSYTFAPELGGHILARHSQAAGSKCKGPADFDCDHGDLLYIFEESNHQLKAIYFDNEGHTIHYDVLTTAPTTVVFLSEPAPGPRFRLVYTRAGDTMSGKFQMQPPGSTEWRSYLEWSGAKQ
jgi:hypothetical protein